MKGGWGEGRKEREGRVGVGGWGGGVRREKVDTARLCCCPGVGEASRRERGGLLLLDPGTGPFVTPPPTGLRRRQRSQ